LDFRFKVLQHALLAESKIPKPELLAISWFAAYLAATTMRPNAEGERAQLFTGEFWSTGKLHV